ncbi:glycerophosphodiester phosphodiesterase family protein [Desulfobaculum senezii]
MPLPSLTLLHDTPLIWAHRGGRSLAPENTLAALRQGHATGADGWELDVQLTKDGEVIVLHDLNLLRTTNAAAHPAISRNPPLVPWRFTLAELTQLSAGLFPRGAAAACAHPGGISHASLPSADTAIPTLRGALALSAELGMWVNIEIKDLSKALPRPLAKSIVDAVLRDVAAAGMDRNVVISSFNHAYLRAIKDKAPHILTGALTPHTVDPDPVRTVRDARADAWHPGYRGLTEATVRAARGAGIAVTPYTVNTVPDMQRLTDWGVTGIVTDRPQDAAPWRKSLTNASTRS